MPYRDDARGDEASRRRRVTEAEARLREAAQRVQATAGTLAQLRRRIDDERRALDEAVEAAEQDQRRAVHAGLALGGDDPRIRAAVRARGAVAALERAMANKGRPRAPKAATQGPPPSYEASKQRLAEARRKRARLVAQQGPTLERAQQRMADAVAAYDEAEAELEAARAALEAR